MTRTMTSGNSTARTLQTGNAAVAANLSSSASTRPIRGHADLLMNGADMTRRLFLAAFAVGCVLSGAALAYDTRQIYITLTA